MHSFDANLTPVQIYFTQRETHVYGWRLFHFPQNLLISFPLTVDEFLLLSLRELHSRCIVVPLGNLGMENTGAV
jgi:hypothetical protein